jgi:hypothetical protein
MSEVHDKEAPDSAPLQEEAKVEEDEETKEKEDEDEESDDVDHSLDEIAQEVLDGKWGQGQEQRQKLDEAGHNHNEVNKAVSRLRNNL